MDTILGLNVKDSIVYRVRKLELRHNEVIQMLKDKEMDLKADEIVEKFPTIEAVCESLKKYEYKNLVKLGIPEHYAATIANSRRKYWYISNNKAVIWALNKERLINSGFYDLATAYQSVHVNY